MIILTVRIGNTVDIELRANTKVEALKICKRIVLEGIYHEKRFAYYPPHVIERIDIGEELS